MNGDYIGGKYEPSGDVYKILKDGTKIYAYYYYYDEDTDVGVNALAFNLTPMQMNIGYDVVFNIYVDKDEKITRCKYMRIRN